MSKERYTLVSGLLVLAGLAAALYLTVLHVRVHTDPNYHSVCAISSGVNCETVAESKYALFLGVPVAVWGVLGYVAMALALMWSMLMPKSDAPLGAMVVLTLVSVLTSLTLGYISVTKISSVCIFCCFTYVVNAILFGLTLWTGWGRVTASVKALVKETLDNLRYSVPLGVLGLAAVSCLVACYPHYWEKKNPTLEAVPEGTATTKNAPGKAVKGQDASGATAMAPRSAQKKSAGSDLTSGVDEEGHPWYGAARPKVVIHEYSDYQCPFCAMFHAKARALVKQYRGKIRLVHHNFPLDGKCNPLLAGRKFHDDACRRAKMAVCAQAQGKFWKANDWLFSHRKDSFTVERFAREVGLDAAKLKECMTSGATAQKLKQDLDKGMSHSIEGTPTYIVNGKKYWFEQLEKALPSMVE